MLDSDKITLAYYDCSLEEVQNFVIQGPML